ncbi:MAG: redox-sensing transcriptional repressor Rex [Armatimonadota bacterium]
MPKAVILRLESYLTYLGHLKSKGQTTATSEELADLFGISSSRVRQDLVALGAIGKPRAGYEIDDLEKRIIEALDVHNIKKIALIGFGNLGRALASSNLWNEGGFKLVAIFDTNPDIVGLDFNGIRVRNITELIGTIKGEEIDAACLTVPSNAAQEVSDLLVSAGIKGIWNFAPVKINVPDYVVVENQNLAQGLMTLSHKMKS